MLLAAVLAVLAGELVMVLTWHTQDGPEQVAWDLAVAASWTAVGWAACLLRPERRIGQLMLMFAALQAAVGPASAGLQDHGWLSSAAVTVGYALVPFQTSLGVHLLLAFPSGWLSERSHQRLVAVAYGYAAIDSIGLLLTLPRQAGECDGTCAENLANVVADPGIHATVTSISATGWLPLIGWFAFLVVRRYRRAGRRQRHVLAPPFAATAAILVAFLWLTGYGVIHGVNVSGAGPAPAEAGARASALLITLLAVPGCFLLGLLRERLAYSGVSDMLRDLDTRADLVPPDVTSALARALRDPTLQVAFPMGDRLVDVHGRPIALPGDRTRSTTPVGEASQPLAVLIHDPTLDDEPELLVAAGSAARLTLDNARLHAEVIAQLAEVRASRSRIIAAADEARRRLERDLHDGAQQRLLAAGLALQLLRTQLTDSHAAADLLTEAGLELTATIRELRELATGIHPAVLTDQGLRPALLALTSRCPVPMTVLGEDLGRLPEPVESTAYFCTTEAVTNAVKHAHATRITVTLHRAADILTLTVVDDGVGGADPTGSGLRGLADRVAALDGQLTIDSPDGCGTRLTVELPCG